MAELYLSSFAEVAKTALSALIVYLLYRVLYHILYSVWWHPLAAFPGPFWAGITRLWIAWQNYQGKEATTIYELHKKFGPVVRITPTMLSVSDARKLPEIYHRNAHKSAHYSVISLEDGESENVFTIGSPEGHAKLRKPAARPYRLTDAKRMESSVDDRATQFVARLDEEFGQTGKNFDLAQWSNYLVYDTISDLVLGEPVGFVGHGTDIGGFIQALDDVQTLSAFQRRMYPFWRWLMSTWLASYAATTAEDNAISSVFDEIYEKRLQTMDMNSEKKSEKDADRVSLLRTILETQEQEPAPLDAESVKLEAKFHFLAGIDVTAAAFQTILVYILSDWEVYKRVVSEIDSFPGEVRVARQIDILSHCPYYVACVQEALRLCPPAPNILPRLVSPPNMEINGQYVPSSMEISCSPWIVNRDRSLYGNDAELFRPERWLGTSEERKLLTKYSHTFGHGSRICLGKDLAMLILYKIPFQLLRNFDIESLNRVQCGKFVAKGGLGFWKDMRVIISRKPST